MLAGQPAPRPRAEPAARPAPEVLTAEDAPQGELVLAAPAMLAERVASEAGDLPMPPPEAPQDSRRAREPRRARRPADAAEALVAPRRRPAAAAGPRPMNRPRNLRRAPAPRPRRWPRRRSRPKRRGGRRTGGARGLGARSRGRRMVQLGAYRQRGDDPPGLVAAGRRATPTCLSSKSLYVERTTANARVFYRLRVAGFESSEQTRVMCESLRARGIDCIPVTLQ